MADIAAAVFGGITAIEIVIKLFAKWRKHREAKKSLEGDKLAGALHQAPQLIREKCDACLRGLGHVNQLGFADALRTIERCVEHFTRTMKDMFRVAMLGRTLHFPVAQVTLQQLMTGVVGTVESLRKQPVPQQDLSRAVVLRQASLRSVSVASSCSSISGQSSAVRSINSSSSDFRADMQRIEGERNASNAVNAFRVELHSLALERNKPVKLESPIPVMSLTSWEVLRSMQDSLRGSGSSS